MRPLRVASIVVLLLVAVHSGSARDHARVPLPKPTNTFPGNTQIGRIAEKDDVNAIGTRKVGGGRLGNWYSLDAEMRLGGQYSQIVDSKVKLLKDPVVTDYIARIAQNLVRNSDAQMPFIIKVIDDPGGVNPFSLPGGYLYVPSGLILGANDEAEVAAMMAHEIAHVTAHHATRLMTRNNMFSLGTMPLVLLGGWVGYAVRSGVGVALPTASSAFARNFEAEADYLGLQYTYKAGYDPQAFIAFLERVSKIKVKKSRMAKRFSMYPENRDRLRKSEEEIATIFPARRQYLVSTSEFDDVRAHLGWAKAPKLTLNKKDRGKGVGPVLRRPTVSAN
ncbi:MAG TPA: M48 family metalloprotease [Candidatus Angelobacter sp.]